MSELSTWIWVDALRWRAEREGASCFVLHKGDADAGVVLLKLVDGDGLARLFVPVRDMEGERVWSQPLGGLPVEEARADAYIARRREDDPDIWALEIIDRQGRHFLMERVEE